MLVFEVVDTTTDEGYWNGYRLLKSGWRIYSQENRIITFVK